MNENKTYKIVLRGPYDKNDPVMNTIHKIGDQHKLTKREKEVLYVISVYGFSNKELGDYLYLSEKTVKNHVRSILNKTNASSTRKLLSMVVQNVV